MYFSSGFPGVTSVRDQVYLSRSRINQTKKIITYANGGSVPTQLTVMQRGHIFFQLAETFSLRWMK
jgi:hypothetical protein